MDGIPVIFALFILIFVGIAIASYISAKKRREGLQAIAQQLGFTFSPAKDRSFASRYAFLENMHSGSNRYAFNILSGLANNDESAHIFDYHYETHSTDSKGNRSTHHHYFSIFTLTLPRPFPELNIKPEGFFAKIAQSLGFDDIDFESHEFSKRYNVKSANKKFAYDFCNAQMIDYLLKQRNLIIEVEGNTLALTFQGKLSLEAILPNHNALLKIRSLMPNYLFSS